MRLRSTCALPADGCVEPRPRVTPPFPALAGVSRGIGHSLFTIDSNGAVRRLVANRAGRRSRDPVVFGRDRDCGEYHAGAERAASTKPATARS